MANPLSIIFALAGGILPALVWLIFWLREDKAQPEPRALLAAVFLAGAAAVIPTYLIQELMRMLWNLTATTGSPLLVPTVLAWAGSEELIKYLVVAAVALHTRYFDEPLDAMVYMVTVALGFAAAENSLFMLNVIGNGGDHFNFLLNGNFRFIGATIVHVVSSSILGSLIALAYCHSRRSQALALFAGLLLATGLHGFFNYLIITSVSDDILKIFILFWALAVVVIYLFERVKKIACHFQTNP